MRKPDRPFERYRTRSALFLMIYGVTAIIAGIPNIGLVTHSDDKRFLIILATSVLVVSRFVGYIQIAGYALLNPENIKARNLRITTTVIGVIVVLLANAAYFLYRFGLSDFTVIAISAGCIGTAGLLLTHLMASRTHGLNRARLMRMVTGMLIIIGASNICILNYGPVSPVIGLITLFFGIYTERKSLTLAVRQTFAAAGGAAGAGLTFYFLRWYLDPALVGNSPLQPLVAIAMGSVLVIGAAVYYYVLRRTYAASSLKSSSK